MLPKLTSDAYQFNVSRTEKGVLTVLTQTETGNVKNFFNATGNVDAIAYHMNSLTDSQCEQWFNASKRVKKEKQK